MTSEGLLQAMEEAWRSCAATPQPDYIIANGRFMLAYRRAVRPPRQRVGGCSARSIKRRAVRRPW